MSKSEFRVNKNSVTMHSVHLYGEVRDIPTWANYATIDGNGDLCVWENEPVFDAPHKRWVFGVLAGLTSVITTANMWPVTPAESMTLIEGDAPETKDIIVNNQVYTVPSWVNWTAFSKRGRLLGFENKPRYDPTYNKNMFTVDDDNEMIQISPKVQNPPHDWTDSVAGVIAPLYPSQASSFSDAAQFIPEWANAVLVCGKIRTLPKWVEYIAINLSGDIYGFSNMPIKRGNQWLSASGRPFLIEEADEGLPSFTRWESSLRKVELSPTGENTLVSLAPNGDVVGNKEIDVYGVVYIVPNWVEWAATDKDGEISGFERKPMMHKDQWVSDGFGTQLRRANDGTSPVEQDWKNSLINVATENDAEATKPFDLGHGVVMHIPEWVGYVATDKSGDIFGYECLPEVVKGQKRWYADGKVFQIGEQTGKGWKKSLMVCAIPQAANDETYALPTGEPEPKPFTLNDGTVVNLPSWVRFVATNKSGEIVGFERPPCIAKNSKRWTVAFRCGGRVHPIGFQLGTDWKDSLKIAHPIDPIPMGGHDGDAAVLVDYFGLPLLVNSKTHHLRINQDGVLEAWPETPKGHRIPTHTVGEFFIPPLGDLDMPSGTSYKEVKDILVNNDPDPYAPEPMPTLQTLAKSIEEWFIDRGFMNESNDRAMLIKGQALKLGEEALAELIYELWEVEQGASFFDALNERKAAIEDAIGDAFVVMTGLKLLSMKGCMSDEPPMTKRIHTKVGDPRLGLAASIGRVQAFAARERTLDMSIELNTTLVALASVAEKYVLDLHSCVKDSYDEIKDRKGEMRGGIFVKEQDL